MSRNLSKREKEEYLRYVTKLNRLIKQMVFPIYDSKFYDCDCDVTWAQELYRAAAEEAGFWTKLKYKIIVCFLPADKTFVRQLCLVDSIVGLSSLESLSVENRRRLLDARADSYDKYKKYLVVQDALEATAADLKKIALAKAKLFRQYCIDSDWIEEMFDPQEASRANVCTDLIEHYQSISNYERSLNAFGHQAMGGVEISKIQVSDVLPRKLHY